MKKYIMPIVLMLITTACNLDIAPENTMVDQTVYKNEKTAEAALLGAYNRFNAAITGSGSTFGSSTLGYPYLFADIGTPTLMLRVNSSYFGMETSDYSAGDYNGYIKNVWIDLYNAIDYANSVIKGIRQYGEYAPEMMARHIAEAKFLRAYDYLILLQMYGDGALIGNMNGDGVIMNLEPYEGYNPDDAQTRVSVGATYQQIIQDLNEALPALSNEVSDDLVKRTRATRTAAYALLSRVYLYRGTYTADMEDLKLASNYADSVLNYATAQGYAFSTSYNDHVTNMFPKNLTDEETNSELYSNEVILLQPSYSKLMNYSHGLRDFYSKNNLYVDPAFIAKYGATDNRGLVGDGATSLIWGGTPTAFNADYTTAKYSNGNGYNNAIYIRLSEVKLTKAEALARLNGIDATAIAHLNDIYLKAYATKPAAYTTADFSSSTQLIDRILEERLKELAFEGHTRYDFIRTKRPLRVATIADNRKNLPIPQYDINISHGKLVQNSGYR